MSADSKPPLELEIAHVLFIDIVGYSKMLTDDQRDVLGGLNQLVRANEEFRVAEQSGKLVRLPTGDGMALAFFTSPAAPLRCAVDLAKALRDRAQIPVRMGIHSGPVTAVTDVNDRSNLAGAGINIAQRVMDCGDAGHILLSKRVTEDLEHDRHWRPHLHVLGEVEVKHGLRLGIVNFYTDEIGNRETPVKLGGARKQNALSIAVLPFVNQSGDPGQEYFADGLTDELINRLGQIRPLLVIGRNSSFAFKGKTEDSRAIGQTLGVANLLEGSVRKAGDRVRISAGLVKAADGSQLWSRSFDRELKDIFAVQEEIANSIGGQLRVTLLGEAGESRQAAPTENLEAYNAFLEGNFYDERRNRDDYFKAVESYNRAIDLDPNFALAYARLSLAERWFHNWGAKGPKDRTPAGISARAHARRAVELAPDLADAHVALGAVQAFRDFDLRAAEVSFKRALAIEPAHSLARYNLADVTASLGRIEEAVSLCREVLALEPLKAAIHFYLGWYLLGLGRFDEAENSMRRAIDLQPNASGFHSYLGIVEIKRGNPDQALRHAQSEPQASERRYGLALAHHARGDRAAADVALNEMIRCDADLNPLGIAAVYAFRGEAGKAFEWLDRAWAVRDPGVTTILFDPFLDVLRGDPRFQDFCRKAGLPV